MARMLIATVLIAASCASTETLDLQPGQVWTFKDASSENARVILGEIETRGDVDLVHVQLAGLPLTERLRRYAKQSDQELFSLAAETSSEALPGPDHVIRRGFISGIAEDGGLEGFTGWVPFNATLSGPRNSVSQFRIDHLAVERSALEASLVSLADDATPGEVDEAALTRQTCIWRAISARYGTNVRELVWKAGLSDAIANAVAQIEKAQRRMEDPSYMSEEARERLNQLTDEQRHELRALREDVEKTYPTAVQRIPRRGDIPERPPGIGDCLAEPTP